MDDGRAGEDIEERGRLLFARPCAFMLGVADLVQLPEAGPVEIGFCGRSNVGKSTLLNALLNRRDLARTSNTPGRTQELNYFELDGGPLGRLWLVDMPGYGFARAPKAKVAAWTDMIRAYLSGRQTLRRVCLLIDARHGPKPVDEEFMALMDRAAVVYQAVLTKADKLKPGALETVVERTRASLAKRPAAHPEVLATASVTGLGMAELRGALASLAEPPISPPGSARPPG